MMVNEKFDKSIAFSVTINDEQKPSKVAGVSVLGIYGKSVFRMCVQKCGGSPRPFIS